MIHPPFIADCPDCLGVGRRITGREYTPHGGRLLSFREEWCARCQGTGRLLVKAQGERWLDTPATKELQDAIRN